MLSMDGFYISSNWKNSSNSSNTGHVFFIGLSTSNNVWDITPVDEDPNKIIFYLNNLVQILIAVIMRKVSF